MPIIEITSLSQPGVEIFSTLTEAQLRNRIEPSKGIFIAESPKVISVAMDAGYEPLALLCEQKHITGDAATIIERSGNIPSIPERGSCSPLSPDILLHAVSYVPCVVLSRAVLKKYAGKPAAS